MTLLRQIRLSAISAVRREQFDPRILGLFTNPFYIIRRGLWSAIAAKAASIEGRVLDFGCGSKPYEALFSHCQSYVGCDIEVSGHDHSLSKVDFFYDGTVLPFESGKFDSAVSFETFEHVFNIREIFREVHRVLVPGGNFLLTVPFAWDEHEQPHDFARYTQFGMRHILEESGFEIVSIDKSGNFVLALFQLAISYIYQHLIPSGIAGRILASFTLWPITIMAYFLDFILPKRDQFFCNLIVVARRSLSS